MMGFFSWNCRGCNESIKAPYDLPEAIEWQNDIVALRVGSGLLRGRYDGYGRVQTDAGLVALPHEGAECWHFRCWEGAGSPKSYTAASPDAEDQGFFYAHSGPVISDRLKQASDLDALVDEIDGAVGRFLKDGRASS